MDKYKNLGKTATDKVTGFTGVCTGIVQYMYGCEQVMITPRVDLSNKRPEAEYFDEGRIEFGEIVVTPESVTADEPGCERREYPTGR